MSEMVEYVAKAIAEADGDNTVMDHHRRRALNAMAALEELGWGPHEWPEPGPNSVFKPHTTTSVSMDNLWVEIVPPETDHKP